MAILFPKINDLMSERSTVMKCLCCLAALLLITTVTSSASAQEESKKRKPIGVSFRLGAYEVSDEIVGDALKKHWLAIGLNGDIKKVALSNHTSMTLEAFMDITSSTATFRASRLEDLEVTVSVAGFGLGVRLQSGNVYGMVGGGFYTARASVTSIILNDEEEIDWNRRDQWAVRFGGGVEFKHGWLIETVVTKGVKLGDARLDGAYLFLGKRF
jgi:hypothetical protein